MRLVVAVFCSALAGFLVLAETEAGALALGLIAAALLVVLGYRDGGWRALRFALIVPAAAVAADVVLFTPLSLQTSSDPVVFTGVALYYLPVWALLVAIGIGVRRLAGRPRAA